MKSKSALTNNLLRRSNCETFCNMVLFNIPESTQAGETVCLVRGECEECTEDLEDLCRTVPLSQPGQVSLPLFQKAELG